MGLVFGCGCDGWGEVARLFCDGGGRLLGCWVVIGWFLVGESWGERL